MAASVFVPKVPAQGGRCRQDLGSALAIVPKEAAALVRIADNTVTPVNVATDQPGPSLHTSGWLNYQDGPSAAAISPDSQTLYVAVRSGLETFRVSLPPMRSSSVTSTRRPQRSS
jgi:hypothetical protein